MVKSHSDLPSRALYAGPLRMSTVGAALFALATLPPSEGAAQVAPEDYARAERFLGWNARNLIAGDEVSPVWLENDRFWYRNRLHGNGRDFVLVDPARRTRDRAFDHERLATAL